VLDYGLNDRGVRVTAGAGNFSPHHRFQTASGAKTASYPMGTSGPFPGSIADHSPPSSAENLHPPNTPSWRGAQLKKKHKDIFIFTLMLCVSELMV
jgi:hypothetical protein